MSSFRIINLLKWRISTLLGTNLTYMLAEDFFRWVIWARLHPIPVQENMYIWLNRSVDRLVVTDLMFGLNHRQWEIDRTAPIKFSIPHAAYSLVDFEKFRHTFLTTCALITIVACTLNRPCPEYLTAYRGIYVAFICHCFDNYVL